MRPSMRSLGLTGSIPAKGTVASAPPMPHGVADHTRATNPRPLDGGVYRRLFAEALG